jgi:hypothetical protein
MAGFFLVSSLPGSATDRTWTGTSGIDNNWMTPGNWQGGVAPSPGDNLIFPSGIGSNLTNHNNFPDGTTFGKITLSPGPGQDYTIGGNHVILTNGMAESVAGLSSFVYFNITLGADQTFTASKLLVFNNVIDLQAYQLIVSNTANVTFNGILKISPGNVLNRESLIKTNTGTLTFSSTATISSTNSPQVVLSQGTLVMNGVATNAGFSLTSGSMVLDGVVSTVSVNSPGVSVSGTGMAGGLGFDVVGGTSLCVPGDNGAPGVLKCNFFSSANSGSGSLLQIKANGTTPGTGYSQLLINSSYDLGPDISEGLAVQWGYTPQIGDSFLVITQASGTPYSLQNNGYFAGQPPNSVFDSTNGSSQAVLYSSNGVSLTTIRTSTSPFSLWKGFYSFAGYGPRNWSYTANWAQGIVPTNWNSVVFSPYQVMLFDSSFNQVPAPPITNDLVSGTSLVSLLFSGSNYILYGNAVTLTGGITNSAAGGTNFCNLDLATVGPLTLDVEPGGTLALSGKFAGSGSVRKEGGGTLQYVGTTMNSFVGTVVVDGGTLQVDGSFTDGSFTVNGGVLGGTGSVSAVTISGGTLEPGDGLGVFQVQGDFSMAPGAVFATQLNGPFAGSSYGQLQVNGGVSLNGATLHLQPGFAAPPGAAFLILVNDGTDAVVGTFAGLPEGAVFSAGGQVFTISYRAGSGGNDVVVTRVNAPPSHFTNIGFVNSNVVELRGIGLSNVNYAIQANTNLLTTNWINIGIAAADGSGNFFFDASNSTSFPIRFFRVVSP